MSLEDIVKSLATSTQQFRKETRTSISNLEAQMGDIVTSVSKLESRGKLPSPTEKNPNVNIMTLRSGNQTGESSLQRKSSEDEEEIEITPIEDTIIKNDTQVGFPKKTTPLVTPIATQPPFPYQLATSKKNVEEKEILVTFQKGERDVTFSSAVIDLGVMPYSLNESLNMDHLSEIGVITSLADKSTAFPRRCFGASEPIGLHDGFYVIDLKEQVSSKSAPIFLGKPFLKTDRTKIDVYAGSLTMEFDGETISFNIYDAMRYASDVLYLYFVDVVEPLT
ncbi:uncharacterized protein LOC111918209 [Lactuca sativa]|uniref:uncharacterized protein LOC111918209 n=1 Tax=Lactuca sativa TaxID=4236 RepID=UPI000CD9817B|nr:uncharacterized protein LOC111918209 [Lactuca sativa]